MNKSIKPIIKIGENILDRPKEITILTYNSEWDSLINNLDDYSHLFVLGCVGDKQITAERAWGIPMRIGELLGGFEFDKFKNLSANELSEFFQENSLHRFNANVSNEYYLAIRKIESEYNGVANKIWRSTRSSAAMFGRFLEFKGIGQKIASMAVNILLRNFKELVEDTQWIDVSPDRHVIRVFKRTGIIRQEASKEEIIWKAKELNPKYPGVFDLATFTIGKEYCKQTNPICQSCPLTKVCMKIIN